MRSIIIYIVVFVISLPSLLSQERYFTKQGFISFYSSTPVEDIKAENNQVLSIFDITTGEIVITILMKSFAFEKALMQEHFNENYVESNKYPKASFSGKITNLENILGGDVSIAEIEGDLTIKDATKPVRIESTFTREGNTIILHGNFMITVADFNIKIPAIVRRNIAEEVDVSFRLIHEPYK